MGGSVRRLVLIRHAKSAWPWGVPDVERPLAGKGRRRAQAAGQWLSGEGPALDLVLCSPATRARQTGEILRPFLPGLPWRTEPRLYEADADQLLAVVAALPDLFETVAVIGHEPAMSQTVLRLAGTGSDPHLVAQVEEKFPTSAIAVLRLAGPWASIGHGPARLETFVVPRAESDAVDRLR